MMTGELTFMKNIYIGMIILVVPTNLKLLIKISFKYSALKFQAMQQGVNEVDLCKSNV